VARYRDTELPASEIARELHVAMSDEENEQLGAMPTGSLEANNEYVRGEQEMLRITPESMRRPFTMTNVRALPSPRRLADEPPGPSSSIQSAHIVGLI